MDLCFLAVFIALKDSIHLESESIMISLRTKKDR